ncbi:MAG: HAMP domain-containing sensor histidine kinase [Planctomycetota bacterium]
MSESRLLLVRRRWWVFALAAAAALAALATVTWIVIEQQRFQAEQRALQERQMQLETAARQMQSAMLPILGAESTRAPREWKSIFEDVALIGPEGQNLEGGNPVVPSPLLGPPATFFRLYFEWAPETGFRSPHLPREAIRATLIERQWTHPDWLLEAERRLDELRTGAVQDWLADYAVAHPPSADSDLMRPEIVPLAESDQPALMLLRSVPDPPRIQGVVVDWPLLRSRILDDKSGLVRDARLITEPLESATPDETSASLAPIPVQIELDADPPLPPPFYATRALIVAAWAGTLVGLAALAVALASAVRESARRGRFASIVSHELRTPLTTFRMVSEMLARDMVDDAQARQEYFDTLVRESERLQRVVDNVLQHTRVEQRRASLGVDRHSLAALLERVLPPLERHALAGGLLFDAEDPRAIDAQVIVRTDPSAVEQILLNLVDNAVKYAGEADPPFLRVRIKLREREVAIRVEDEGPGVPADQRERLFRPFERLERTSHLPGLGLGLPLARGLARDAGGDLVLLDAEPSSGARFELTLPRVTERPLRQVPADQ